MEKGKHSNVNTIKQKHTESNTKHTVVISWCEFNSVKRNPCFSWHYNKSNTEGSVKPNY